MKQITIILFLLIGSQVFAQSLLQGRIVDGATQEGIAYTNIGIEGTFFGTASNQQGFFELKVPDEFLGESLYVSAVGYENASFPVKELLKLDFARIPLSRQTYNIEGIDVTAQSRVLFRVIRTAAQQVPLVFHGGPLGLTFHYLERTQVGDAEPGIREAIVELYDETGYQKPSVTDAYNNRKYRFTQVNRNFDVYSFPSGQTGFDELLEMDLARLSNTIFSGALLNDFDLHLEGVSIYEGDSVWVISYKTNQMGLAYTGDCYATKMDGKMYVLKSNYALVRNETVIEASRNNPQNRSLFTETDEQQQVYYHLTSIYREQDGKYVLSYLDCDKTFINEKGEQVSNTRKASVLKLSQNPEKMSGRDYFEDTDYDERFWKSFHDGQAEASKQN